MRALQKRATRHTGLARVRREAHRLSLSQPFSFYLEISTDTADLKDTPRTPDGAVESVRRLERSVS